MWSVRPVKNVAFQEFSGYVHFLVSGFFLGFLWRLKHTWERR